MDETLQDLGGADHCADAVSVTPAPNVLLPASPQRAEHRPRQPREINRTDEPSPVIRLVV
jgi:hypothetical protein